MIELLEITEEIRNLIVNSGTASEIYAKARANGFISMQEDGILKVLS
ncbi:hypothetical protein J5893_03635 [bacterium]|nr:hypothetical protein [bacterium]